MHIFIVCSCPYNSTLLNGVSASKGTDLTESTITKIEKLYGDTTNTQPLLSPLGKSTSMKLFNAKNELKSIIVSRIYIQISEVLYHLDFFPDSMQHLDSIRFLVYTGTCSSTQSISNLFS